MPNINYEKLLIKSEKIETALFFIINKNFRGTNLTKNVNNKNRHEYLADIKDMKHAFANNNYSKVVPFRQARVT